MQVAEIELYEILKAKIGEKEAKTLVEYIESKVDKELEGKKDVLATKQDIAALEIKIEKTHSDIVKWMFLFWVGQLVIMAGLIKFIR